MVESPAPVTLVLGALREQHPKTDMAGRKGQQYLKTSADSKPLSLGLIHFCAFKDVSLSSSGCCVKALYSLCGVGISMCMWKEKYRNE